MTERLNIINIDANALHAFRKLSVYSGMPYGKLLSFLMYSWIAKHPKQWEAVLKQAEEFAMPV